VFHGSACQSSLAWHDGMAWKETELAFLPRYTFVIKLHTLSVKIGSAKAARIRVKKADYFHFFFSSFFFLLHHQR
jgi:hypothetical protein